MLYQRQKSRNFHRRSVSFNNRTQTAKKAISKRLPSILKIKTDRLEVFLNHINADIRTPFQTIKFMKYFPEKLCRRVYCYIYKVILCCFTLIVDLELMTLGKGNNTGIIPLFVQNWGTSGEENFFLEKLKFGFFKGVTVDFVVEANSCHPRQP